MNRLARKENAFLVTGRQHHSILPALSTYLNLALETQPRLGLAQDRPHQLHKPYSKRRAANLGFQLRIEESGPGLFRHPFN